MHAIMRRSLPIAALALVAAAPRPAAVDGWTFTWKVTAEGSDGKTTQRGAPPTMKVSIIPGRARLDYLESAPPGQKKGSYMIIDAEKGDFIMVSPEDKAAIVMDPSALGSMLSAVGQTRLVKFDVTDVNVAVDQLGAGEKILGRSTTRYRVTRDYKMDVSVLGRHNRTTHHSESEMWMTSEKITDDKVFETWARSFTGSLTGIGGDAFKKLSEAESKLPKGAMLKMVSTSTDTDDKGKVTTMKMAMEMQELAKASLDASLFRVPDGYQVNDMKAQMAAASDSMKAAKAECEKENGKGNCEMPSLDSAIKSGAKAGAAEAAKKKLKGLFKKP